MLLPPACLMGLLLVSMSRTSAGCVCLVRFICTQIHASHTSHTLTYTYICVKCSATHTTCALVREKRRRLAIQTYVCIVISAIKYILSDSLRTLLVLDVRPQTNPANSTCTNQIVTNARKRDREIEVERCI